MSIPKIVQLAGAVVIGRYFCDGQDTYEEYAEVMKWLDSEVKAGRGEEYPYDSETPLHLEITEAYETLWNKNLLESMGASFRVILYTAIDLEMVTREEVASFL